MAAYNFTYQKPPTNFSFTLVKPGKPKWGKSDGVFVKTEETKGVTINGTVEPPIVSEREEKREGRGVFFD